jgi:apolipoprotein N-acyltransferase
LARDVADGADGLATLTTVASYGTSSVSDQLLAAAQLRAAELQKPMVVAATTGRSAFIAPDGARLATSALFEADRLVGQMALRSGSTPFARYGDLPVIVVAVGVLIAVGLLRRRRPSRTEPVARDDGHTRHDQDAADVRTAP